MKHIIFSLTLCFFSISESLKAEPEQETAQAGLEIAGEATFIFDALDYALKRVPNIEEVALDVGGQVVLEVAFFDYTSQLGNNPSSKSGIRDAIKIPGAILKAFRGTQVGGTEFRFDSANVYSQVGKTLGKAGTIYALVHYSGQDARKASLIANYFGEYISRFLINAGKAQQLAGSQMDFGKFTVQEVDAKWVLNALAEGSPKVVVSNWVGWAIGDKLGIGELIRTTLTDVINNVSPWVISPNLSFINDARQNFPNDAGIARRYSTYVTFFVLQASVAFVETFAVTYLMAPPSRLAQDIGSDLLNSVHAWINKKRDVAKSEL